MAHPPSPSLLLKHGRLLDPASGTDAALDVAIEGGRVTRIGKGLSAPAGARIVPLGGLWVTPGLVDLHTHLREPGDEHKETVATGSASAAAGGFTSVCAMPNTRPVNDSRAVTELLLRRAADVNGVRVFPVGAVTQGLLGEQLTNMGSLKAAGVVAFSDDGRPVMNARLMRRALEYARTFDVPIVQHAEDLHLSDGGVMNEGSASARAGLRGQPPEAEHVMVGRDLALVERIGARYHVAHASTRKTLELVREAKRRGLPVSCEVTPHHLTLTDEACLGYDTSMKVNPPLRSDPDRAALLEGLADGTVDAIATDHAPHSPLEKELEFDQAAFGMVGLETALPITLGLVEAGVLPLLHALDLLTARAARLFRLPVGSLVEGGVADVAVIDPSAAWTVERSALRSRSKNTPFAGRAMKGRAVLTLVGGRSIHDLLGGGAP